MGTPVIELRGVAAIYEGERLPAIHDIDLRVEQGEFVALIGPNGVGKTTLLETINGLLENTAGEVRVFGQGIGRYGHQIRQRVGYIPQEISFDERTPFLVKDVVLMGRFGRIGLTRRPAAADHRAVEQALKLVGIEDLACRPIGKLSGGQQQKAMLARALAKGPELLLLDEPFGALDERTRHHLQEELLSIWERERKTILFVTHNIDEAVFLASRILVMRDRPGRIEEEIKVNLPRPRDRMSEEFIDLHIRIREILERILSECERRQDV